MPRMPRFGSLRLPEWGDAAQEWRERLAARGAAARAWAVRWAVRWLEGEAAKPQVLSPINFAHLMGEARMGDVLLVEGHARVSRAVRSITRSIWTHAGLVVGRLDELRDPALRSLARAGLGPDELEAPLLVESELGRGVFVSSLLRYREAHLRLCRPRGLSYADARRVATYALLRLGADYNVRQILDLARFLVPWWAFLPRRWHSSLFERHHQEPTRLICSTMIARAFNRVRFPVLPLVVEKAGRPVLLERSARLITPSDFDHSPYFDVIKYPLLGRDDIGFYRTLPWSDRGLDLERVRSFLEDPGIWRVQLDESQPQAGRHGAE